MYLFCSIDPPLGLMAIVLYYWSQHQWSHLHWNVTNQLSSDRIAGQHDIKFTKIKSASKKICRLTNKQIKNKETNPYENSNIIS